MKSAIIAATGAAAALLAAGGVQAFPAYGADTAGPTILITFGPGGSEIITNASSQGPYDGSDDTYVGVINNSGATITSFNLSSTSEPIFAFEGDGIDTYGAVENPGNPDTTGYGGPNAFFTNISSDLMSGTVNFTGGIANGGSDYFSLEEALTASSIGGGVPEPASWALMLLGFGGIGFAVRRRNGLATAA